MRRRMLGLTTKDYIQDSIVLHLDGIDNVAQGIHDNNATTWIDLTGNHVLKSYADEGIEYHDVEFKENAAYFNGEYFYKTQSDLIKNALNNNTCTIEFLFSCNNIKNRNNSNNVWFAFGYSVRGAMAWDLTTGSGWVVSAWSRGTNSAQNVKADNSTTSNYKTYSIWVYGKTINVCNGYRVVTSSATGVSTDNTVRLMAWNIGYLHAVRVHNRILTLEELQYNLNVDMKRFNINKLL